MRAGKGGQVAVAGTVDKDFAEDGAAAGFGFDQQCLDAAIVVHDDAGGERVKQNVDLVRQQQIVGRAFIRGGVVGLRQNFAEHEMRRVEAAEFVDARQQIVGDAMHDLFDLAMHVGMQAAEIGDAGRRAHAAEKAVAFDQQARCGRAGRRRPRPPVRPVRHPAPRRHNRRRFRSGVRGSIRCEGLAAIVEFPKVGHAQGGLQWPPPSPLLRRLARRQRISECSMGLVVLIIGLAVFLGSHLFITRRDARAAAIAQLGVVGYRALFSVVSIVGLALIVWGYGEYRAHEWIAVWTPPAFMRHITITLMLLASISIVATFIPSHIKMKLKHPMLTSGEDLGAGASVGARRSRFDPAVRFVSGLGRVRAHCRQAARR